jgi:hypothetical protein
LSAPALTLADAPSCSCLNYFTPAPRPDWVKGEIETSASYISHGITECRGIKTLDIDKADQAARLSLSKMIQVNVSSVLESDIEQSTSRGVRKDIRQTSRQISDVSLHNARIFARWVDPVSCTVYSGIQVSKTDIQNYLDDIKNRLVNQAFAVRVGKPFNSEIHAGLRQLLIDAGVRSIEANETQAAFIIDGQVDINYSHNGRAAYATLVLNLYDREQNLAWSMQTRGKGVTFGSKTKTELARLAITHAISEADPEIRKVLSKTPGQLMKN